jgi:hypothetical protein
MITLEAIKVLSWQGTTCLSEGEGPIPTVTSASTTW